MRNKLLFALAAVLLLIVAGCTMPETAPAAEAPAANMPDEDASAGAGAMAESMEEQPMAEGEVSMARATWDTGWFQAEVFKQLLQELGYDVTIVGDLPPETFYPALAKGDVDLWANGWFPLHDTFLESDVVAGQVEPVGFQVEAGALQGFLVDKATADEFGITSLADFADPDIAALFDTDGDGTAELTGCDAGWGCEGAINTILADQGLEDSITHVQGTYSLLMADTIARYQRGEPVFFYTWTPNWTINQLKLGEDVVWITVPGSDATAGVMGCTEDPCAMGFVANDIRAVANTEFLAENPAAQTLLSEIEIPLNDIANENQLLVDGEDSIEDIEGHATTWIEENRDLVDQWLETARSQMS